jgi:hypothetical protein
MSVARVHAGVSNAKMETLAPDETREPAAARANGWICAIVALVCTRQARVSTILLSPAKSSHAIASRSAALRDLQERGPVAGDAWPSSERPSVEVV